MFDFSHRVINVSVSLRIDALLPGNDHKLCFIYFTQAFFLVIQNVIIFKENQLTFSRLNLKTFVHRCQKM